MIVIYLRNDKLGTEESYTHETTSFSYITSYATKHPHSVYTCGEHVCVSHTIL